MARIDLDANTLPELERRIAALDPGAQRLWGTMSLAQMMAHLRITLEVSLEERETRDESIPFLTPVIYWLLFQVWTDWPKGKIKASAQFLNESANDLESEREQLIAAMHRFIVRAAVQPKHKVLEPMLGRVTLRQWARIHGVHIDYHLRQFGG